jgi:hypothetical protein
MIDLVPALLQLHGDFLAELRRPCRATFVRLSGLLEVYLVDRVMEVILDVDRHLESGNGKEAAENREFLPTFVELLLRK